MIQILPESEMRKISEVGLA
jgi:hypothetical protein